MTEFADLLKEAAGSPPRPLDMAAVHQRAARLGLRRIALWLGLGVATIGIGAPFGSGVLSPADRGASLGVVNGHEVNDRAGPDAAAPRPARMAPSASSADDPQALTSDTTAPPSAALAGESAAGHLPATEYPPATACSVDNTLLANDDQRTCRFTAATSGGWNFYEPPGHYPSNAHDAPVATVTVTRNGTANTYRSRFVPSMNGSGKAYFEGCADNIIARGDLVEVTITQSPSAVVPTQMGAGAGDGWGCADPGP